VITVETSSMVRHIRLLILGAIAIAAGVSLCGITWWAAAPVQANAAHPEAAVAAARPGRRAEEPISPLVAPDDLDPRKVALGRRLFHDPALSASGDMSCATCHSLDDAGVDRRRHELGGALATVDTPTVFNSGLNFRQFWDGRATSLEEQIEGPIFNPREMGARDWPEVVGRVSAIPGYGPQFTEIYPDGISPAAVKDALVAFERSLVTVGSRFDRFLAGDRDALTADEQRGYALFKELGCISCHQGANVGGNMFARMGAIKDFFGRRGKIDERDLGRYNVTAREQDRFRFRVPSLRLVALTAPYLHDGSVATLEEAVALMADHQLGHPISDEEVALVVEFLRTLAGPTEGF
jgi:cytochrome c peroxidase